MSAVVVPSAPNGGPAPYGEDTSGDEDGGGRTRPRAAAAIIGGLAIVTLLLVAAMVVTTRHEGYASPQEALDAFFDALDHGTVADLLAVLPPDEAKALEDTLPQLGTELERLGLVGAADATAAIGLTVERPQAQITTFEEWIGRADLEGGTVALDADPSAQTVLSDEGRAALSTTLGIDLPGAEPEPVDELWPELMVVRDGGGWRVSPAYTVAEQWRLDHDQPEPDWGKGAVAIGSNTPAEVVPDLYRSIQFNDPGRTASLVEPDEGRAWYQYWPLMLPGVAADWDELRDDEGFFFEVGDIQVAVEGSERERIVHVTDYEGTFGDGDTTVDVRYHDGCWEIATWPTASPDSTDAGDGGGGAPPAEATVVDRRCDGDVTAAAPDVGRWSSLVAPTALGRAFPTFVVREHHGRWFVSPTRTVLGTLTEVAAGLADDQGQLFVDALEAAWTADDETPPPDALGPG